MSDDSADATAATDGGTRTGDPGDGDEEPALRSTDDAPVEAAVAPQADPTPAIRPVADDPGDPADTEGPTDAADGADGETAEETADGETDAPDGDPDEDPDAPDDDLATVDEATARERFAALSEGDAVVVAIDAVDDGPERFAGTVSRVDTDAMGARAVLVRDGRDCVKVTERLSSGALRASAVTRGGDATFLGPVVGIARE